MRTEIIAPKMIDIKYGVILDRVQLKSKSRKNTSNEFIKKGGCPPFKISLNPAYCNSQSTVIPRALPSPPSHSAFASDFVIS